MPRARRLFFSDLKVRLGDVVLHKLSRLLRQLGCAVVLTPSCAGKALALHPPLGHSLCLPMGTGWLDLKPSSWVRQGQWVYQDNPVLLAAQDFSNLKPKN